MSEMKTGRFYDRLKQKQSIISAVSQASLSIRCVDCDPTFKELQKEIVSWVARKAGRPLPPEAREGKSFELYRDIGYQPVSAVATEDPRLWACRLDDADKVVAQRTWTTEICLAKAPDG